jgi:RHS repeat-associated protein
MGGRTEERSSRVEVDSLENVISRTQGGKTDASVYDAAGKLAMATPAGKPATVYTYHQEQVVSVKYADEPATTYRYYPSGRLQGVSEPSGRKRLYSWYDRGLVWTEEYGREADTELRAFTYDDGGYLSTSTVGRGTDASVWTYTHGPRGELVQVTQPSGLGDFKYGYDARGQLASIEPPAGGMPSQSFGYDYLGRPVLRTRGPQATWRTSWEGGTATTVDPNGDTTVAVVDGRGRAARVSWQPGPSSGGTGLTAVEKAYDGLDQLLEARETRSSGDVTTTYSYDGRSRLTRAERGGGAWVGYGYTASGERQWVESSAGRVTYGYDVKDRLSTVNSPRGTTVHVEWETGGERLLSAGDEVMKECRGYDSRGRLSYAANLPSGSDCGTIGAVPYARFEYGYDERGNRKSELYSGQGVTGDPTSYGYDGADRLVGVQYGDGSAALYGLAGDGTRQCEKRMDSYGGSLTANACDSGGATESLVYGYDERGGLKSIVDGANGAQLGQFQTDPAGRLRSETRGTFAREYTWDAGGRLTQLTVTQAVAGQGAAVSTNRYGYDFAGRRVSKTDPTGGVTTYLWGGDELAEERLPGGALRYENAAGMALAVGNERLMHDALGSAVGRIGNAAPALYRFDAWGSYRGWAPGVGEASAGYAGQHWDVDAGLSYAQQRWYDLGTGRFLSEDPVFGDLQNPNSLHAFGYANGNPLLSVDPQGTTACMPGDPGSCAQEAEETAELCDGAEDELACRRDLAKAELKGAAVGVGMAGCALAPQLCAAGALTGFGLDSARQGVKQIESGRPGFNWGEAATATGVGAALGPMSRVPGVKQALVWGGGALGVTSAYDEAKQGNTATALFDLAAATLPVAAEYGPKLPDVSLPKPQPARVAATANGGTIVVAGEEVSAGSRPPRVFEARARGGEHAESGQPADPASKNGWKVDASKDLDWRGGGKSVRDALAEAFNRTGVQQDQFEVTRWAKDAHGKSFPVEWRAGKGAEVSIDLGHSRKGPGVPHVGYQTPGKQRIRGHILLDDVNANR